MPLNNTNNYLSSLVGAGADAMTNLYYVKFIDSDTNSDASLSTALTVRTSDISLPAASHTTSSRSYLTVSMDAPKAEISIDKKLDITFRLDENYEVYKYLLNKQAPTSIGNAGYASNVIEKDALTIQIFTLTKAISSVEDAEVGGITSIPTNYTKVYEFRDCWVSSISLDAFSYSNSNELTVKASIYFCEYDDPQSLLVTE